MNTKHLTSSKPLHPYAKKHEMGWHRIDEVAYRLHIMEMGNDPYAKHIRQCMKRSYKLLAKLTEKGE